MHSQADRQLSPADQAYAIVRAKQMVQLMAAARTDPQARLQLARRIFDDAFTQDVPQEDAVRTRNGVALSGYARRDRVPDVPPPPQVYEGENGEAKTQLEQALHTEAMLARMDVIANNERKLRALLWAHRVFLELDPDGDFAHTLESGIREWFMCSLPVLPTEADEIEQCVRANARASGDALRRAKAEREAQAAE